jgi:hypothetical protein
VRRASRRAWGGVAIAAIASISAAACKPDLGPSDSQVTSTRLLAVKAEPPEAKPGSVVTLTSLVASPEGTVARAGIAWSFCVAPKPLTTDVVVSTACLDSSSLVPVGVGPAVYAQTPDNGCRIFGPDTPPGDFRPRDPDVTGGYYQPMRAELAGGGLSFDLLRIACDLGDAPATVAAAFAKQYVANQNPHLGGLSGTIDGAPLTQAGIPGGSRVTLSVGWSDADAETYVWLDPSTQTLAAKRESLRVAWYSSLGAFDTESTGRAEDDLETTTSSVWTVPPVDAPATAHLWLVLRDSRGGVDFADFDLGVVP